MSALSPENLAMIARAASLAWWMYVVVVLSIFFGGLLLNYLVKKINEARLETRFLRNKVPTERSTQVQRPIEIDNKTTASGNAAANLNNGISLIFNKEENLLEDKRRKEDLPTNSGNSDCVVINMENVEEGNLSLNYKDEEMNEMNRSAFLGTIYKDLYEKRAAIEKSKSLSNADRDSILNEIVDKMVGKINESKSTPSIKKLIDIQNERDLKEWALDLVREKDEKAAPASTSGPPKNDIRNR